MDLPGWRERRSGRGPGGEGALNMKSLHFHIFHRLLIRVGISNRLGIVSSNPAVTSQSEGEEGKENEGEGEEDKNLKHSLPFRLSICEAEKSLV